MKFRQCAILCCTCGSCNIVLICHIYTCINIRTHTYTHACTHTCEIQIFNENIRCNKDSGQIEGNKLNKMIEKCKISKFIFSEVSCFLQELFRRFCLDFKWLHSKFGIQGTPFTDISHPKAAIRNLSKILKN